MEKMWIGVIAKDTKVILFELSLWESVDKADF